MDNWYLLTNEPSDAYSNMALDDALLESVIVNEIEIPVLRFYTWDKASISIGRFQSIDKDINLDNCQKDGIPVVRRPTGGRAVFHGTKYHELTYSVIFPSKYALAKAGIQEVYCSISKAFVTGLKKIGISVELEKQTTAHRNYHDQISCFSAVTRYEVLLKNHKIIGSAQVRKHGVILQHGSILLSSEPAMNKYFTNGTIVQKGISDLLQFKIEPDKISDSIQSGFQDYFNIQFQYLELTDRLNIRTVRARQYKYSNPKWIYSK